MQPEQNHSSSRRSFLKTGAAVAAASQIAVPFVHAAGDEKIKIGLVGCGGRGRGATADAVAKASNVTVTAIADLFPEVAEQTFNDFGKRPKEKYNVSKDQVFSGLDAWKKLLETDVNYVILATPPGFRPMMIEAAIKAGKNVFAEKPVAVDPAGVRRVIAASEEAAKKGLGIVCGTQRRHDPGYIETIGKIREGAIGEVTSGYLYWMQGGLRSFARQPGMSDMEWQIRNWWYFTWLSGDHIVEQHMHQHDIMCWVMGGTPKQCLAMGGRQVRTDPVYGHIYDHFAVEYEYANGARFTSLSRQQDGTYGRVGEYIIGTKGASYPQSRLMTHAGKAIWTYEQPEEEVNPYELEHFDHINGIRAGKPLNEGRQCAESSLVAIMGRLAAYTGQIVQYSRALKMDQDLFPKTIEFGPHPVPPVAMPGVDKLPPLLTA